MKRFLSIIWLLALAACSDLPPYGVLTSPETPPVAGRQISITTWNLGYAALGEGADFITDGGTHLRALSAGDIATATGHIATTARSFGSDFLFFQEVARAGFLTRNVPLLATLESALPDYTPLFWPGLHLSEPPDPLALANGPALFARHMTPEIRALEIPQEAGSYLLGIKRYMGVLVTEIPIRNSRHNWVLVNLHLSAFDPNANTRRAQARTVLEFAQREYDKGNYVVLGGDWNMRLRDTDFAHSTAQEYLEWLVDFPQNMLPDGWKIAIDPARPTVRTLQKPYVAGENYTAIIDGFITSPNVAVVRVSTLDTGFRDTDHQPVTGVFRAR